VEERSQTVRSYLFWLEFTGAALFALALLRIPPREVPTDRDALAGFAHIRWDIPVLFVASRVLSWLSTRKGAVVKAVQTWIFWLSYNAFLDSLDYLSRKDCRYFQSQGSANVAELASGMRSHGKPRGADEEGIIAGETQGPLKRHQGER